MKLATLVFTFFFFISANIVLSQDRWETTNGPVKVQITGIVALNGFLFVGTNSGGIFKSSDDGDTWIPTDFPATTGVNSLSVIGSTVYAGTISGYYVSHDNGNTWNNVTIDLGYSGYCFAQKDGYNFVGTNNAVYRALGASRFFNITNGMPYNCVVRSLLVRDNKIYAGIDLMTDVLYTGGGVFVTADNGNHWSAAGMRAIGIYCLGQNGTTVFAGGSDGVYLLTPSRSDWYRTLTCGKVTALNINAQTIYACDGSTIYRSTDGGLSWTSISSNFSGLTLSSLTRKEDKIFIGAQSGGIYKTSDIENSLSKTQTCPVGGEVFSFASNGNLIYASTNKAQGVYISSDNGDNWNTIGPSYTNVLSLYYKNSTLYGAEFPLSRLRSTTDNGATWNIIGITDDAWCLYSDNNVSLAGTTSKGILYSTDDKLWKSSSFNKKWIRGFAAKDNNYFACTYGSGVLYSNDNGATWTQRANGMADTYVYSLLIDNDNMYAGAGRGSLYFSKDMGLQWTPITTSLSDIFALACYNGLLFAGTEYGVYKSEDKGITWKYSGVPCYIRALFIKDGYLFAGSQGRGAWRLPLSSLSTALTTNIKIYLQGSYSLGSMSSNLLAGNLIPFAQPYNSSPWNYSGAETLSSVPAGVVDWVLVELRTGPAASTFVARRAGLLKNDGTIVDLNGISPLSFTGVNPGNYYIVVRHRNHIPVMSSSSVCLGGSSLLYDFTTAQTQAYGTTPMKDLGNGIYGMYAGDSNKDGQITALDFNTWNSNAKTGQAGYVQDDMNLDGQVTMLDFNLWNANTRAGAQSYVQ